MKTSSSLRCPARLLGNASARVWIFGVGPFLSLALVLAVLFQAPSAMAFPPAPFHLLYGVVRDEYGTPLQTAQAKIVLQTPTGVSVSGFITPGLAANVNYKLQVPMDAGLTPVPYKASALQTAAPFKIYVVIGTTTNQPIEMTGDYSRLGQAAQSTRIDLTLGTDANGNGLPDAWERAFLQALGLGSDINGLHQGMDLAGDGLTLQQEYLLGNYPSNPEDTFRLRVAALDGNSPRLEFVTMTGRSYTLWGSTDLKEWKPLVFTLPSEGASAPVRSFYYAPDIRTIEVDCLQPEIGPPVTFFKLMLQ